MSSVPSEQAISPAVLPSTLISKRIFELNLGESAFAEPASMWVDNDNRCWLFGDYPVCVKGHLPKETDDHILVERDDTGFHVTVNPESSYRWTPSSHLVNLDDGDYDDDEHMGFSDLPVRMIGQSAGRWKLFLDQHSVA